MAVSVTGMQELSGKNVPIVCCGCHFSFLLSCLWVLTEQTENRPNKWQGVGGRGTEETRA